MLVMVAAPYADAEGVSVKFFSMYSREWGKRPLVLLNEKKS